MAGRAGAGPRAGGRVVHDRPRDAVLDEIHARAGNALEVDHRRHAARIRTVVPDADALAHQLLAELHERPALLVGQSREADVAEVLEQATDRVLLEDDLVLARLQLAGTAHGVSLGRGLDAQRLGVDLADVGRAGVRVARRGSRAEAVHHHGQERRPAARCRARMPCELATATVMTDVENEPDDWSPFASPAAITARAPSARRSALASAVAAT